MPQIDESYYFDEHNLTNNVVTEAKREAYLKKGKDLYKLLNKEQKQIVDDILYLLEINGKLRKKT